MSTIRQLSGQNQFMIVVSLPKNRLDLAMAASDCGADAMKVHLNVEHKASGTVFGSWAQEKPVITEIIEHVGCPVGIMPGAQVSASQADLDDAVRLGIDFLDIYDFDMPGWMMSYPGLTKMIAVGAGYQVDQVNLLTQNGADLIEASIVPFEQYRSPLTDSDIAAYRQLVQATPLPIVVPSQKKLLPHDLLTLRQIGVKGVILGTICLGDTTESFRSLLPSFINAVR